MREATARRRVESFRGHHGDPHLHLACHAALPLALSPDLAYRLWANFQRDTRGALLGIPWVAVADLLLSPLCEEVGDELYEMDDAVRSVLLERLASDARFGPNRLRRVAAFLDDYVERQLNSDDIDARDFAQAQHWAALAYKAPGAAASELARAFAAVPLVDKPEVVRIASVVEALAAPLGSFTTLLTYAQAAQSVARGRDHPAVRELQSLAGPENRVEVADVSVPVPWPIGTNLRESRCFVALALRYPGLGPSVDMTAQAVERLISDFEAHGLDRQLPDLDPSAPADVLTRMLYGWLLSEDRAGQLVLLYLVGHGATLGPNHYLLTAYTDNQALRSTALYIGDIAEAVAASPAAHVLLMIDICNSETGKSVITNAVDSINRNQGLLPGTRQAVQLVVFSHPRGSADDGGFGEMLHAVLSDPDRWSRRDKYLATHDVAQALHAEFASTGYNIAPILPNLTYLSAPDATDGESVADTGGEPEARLARRSGRSARVDLVLVIPGLGGSALERDGKQLWASGATSMLRMMVGSSLRELTPVRDDPDLDDLGDGVVATRLIQDVNIIPGLFKVDGYTRLLRWLEHALKLEAGRSLVPVPWDWRRDLRVAARQVARVAEESLAAWREMGNPEAKLVLIAHGEGGLVATWFTDVLGGYRDTRLLFTLGTPFRGTVQLLDTLVNGARAGIGRTSDLTAFTRSLSSPYQMLPTYPCIDAGGGELRRVDEVELPDLDRSRVYSGKQFLLQLADAGANRVLESDMQVVPVVGIGQATLQSARLLSGQLMALQRYGSEDYGGDGTVPRFSALPTWLHNEHGAVYCRSRHGQLQSQNQVLEMIEGRITALELVNFR